MRAMPPSTGSSLAAAPYAFEIAEEGLFPRPPTRCCPCRGFPSQCQCADKVCAWCVVWHGSSFVNRKPKLLAGPLLSLAASLA